MALMIHRTTFALDDATNRRIKRLAKTWGVSQAEVVRRAVSLAEAPVGKPDPVSLLQRLHSQDAGLSAETASAYLTEVRKDRQRWRSK